MRSLLPFAPASLKRALVGIGCQLPMRFWLPPVFSSTLSEVKRWESLAKEQIALLQVERLQEILFHCAEHVPYYRRLFREIGFDVRTVHSVDDLAKLPTMDRDIIQKNAPDLLADNIPAWQRAYLTTGGTTGRALGLFNSGDWMWKEWAFMFSQWSRVGFQLGDQRASLRGAAIKSKKLYKYDSKERSYTFSNYHLDQDTAKHYKSIIEKNGLKFFHAYPSAAVSFAEKLRESGTTAPQFRALLLGSEGLYPGQRQFLEEFYGCRVYSWYGHSEALILGGECESSTDYHAFPNYGVLEILDNSGKKVAIGDSGELVGSTLTNYAMPLLRYRTGDYATRLPDGCNKCGRNFPMFRDTKGRWRQEVLVGKRENLISMTALNMHTDVFDRVERFQFYQKEQGRVELRIVRGTDYSDSDTTKIKSQVLAKIGDTLNLEIVFVDSISLTSRGKFRYIVQELNIPSSFRGED